MVQNVESIQTYVYIWHDLETKLDAFIHVICTIVKILDLCKLSIFYQLKTCTRSFISENTFSIKLSTFPATFIETTIENFMIIKTESAYVITY